MTKEQTQVRNWMLLAGQECPTNPIEPSFQVRYLRAELIREEWTELLDAMGTSEIDGMIRDWEPCKKANLVNVADAIADLMYVVIGTAVAFGIDIEPIFDEVHRSNESKFIDGYRREDGKWIKGPSYSPANLQPLIDKQIISTSTT